MKSQFYWRNGKLRWLLRRFLFSNLETGRYCPNLESPILSRRVDSTAQGWWLKILLEVWILQLGEGLILKTTWYWKVHFSPLCKPYRYTLPQRVWFLHRFGLRTGMVYQETTGMYECICHFNFKWIRKKKKHRNSTLQKCAHSKTSIVKMQISEKWR